MIRQSNTMPMEQFPGRRYGLADPRHDYRAYAAVVQAKVAKSKVGDPFRQTLLYNGFDCGFDNAKSVIYFLASVGVLKKEKGKAAVYTSDYFKFSADIDGKRIEIDKLKLSQAKAFLEKFGWPALAELAKGKIM